MVRFGIDTEPRLQVGTLACRGVEARSEKLLRIDLAEAGVQGGSRRVDSLKSGEQAIQLVLPVDQVGLGQDQAVGNRRLLYRLRLARQRVKGVQRIDGRGHAGERQTLGETG